VSQERSLMQVSCDFNHFDSGVPRGPHFGCFPPWDTGLPAFVSFHMGWLGQFLLLCHMLGGEAQEIPQASSWQRGAPISHGMMWVVGSSSAWKRQLWLHPVSPGRGRV
jgi:hypothetical protein